MDDDGDGDDDDDVKHSLRGRRKEHMLCIIPLGKHYVYYVKLLVSQTCLSVVVIILVYFLLDRRCWYTLNM